MIARIESSAWARPGSTTTPGRTPGRYTMPMRTPRSMAEVSWAERRKDGRTESGTSTRASVRVIGGVRRNRSGRTTPRDRKSTRLNSSHTVISYAVFCLKKKKKKTNKKKEKTKEK